MKKLVTTLILSSFCIALSAQKDLRILNHLSIGAEVGTLGWGIDASMPVTPFVDVQAGFSMFPRVTYSATLGTNMDIDGLEELDEFKMKGKVLMKSGKVLVNFMPIPMVTGFHITAGAYFGNGDIMGLDLDSNMPAAIADYNATHPDDPIGLELGDYLLTPDSKGRISGRLKVKKVKPYVGIGIGRGVPKKRIGFKFDVGCVFWGKPSVYCNDEMILDTDVDGDGGKVLKLATKLKVYPVLNFRVCGKIF